MTNNNTTRCMLLELPSELRNNIYEEVFEEEVTIATSHRHPALLRTCRKITNEATKLYYSSTTFRLTPHTFLSAAHPFLKFLPPEYLALIPKIRYLPLRSAELLRIFDMPFLQMAFRTMLSRWADTARTGIVEAGVEESKVEVPWVEIGERKWKWKTLE